MHGLALVTTCEYFVVPIEGLNDLVWAFTFTIGATLRVRNHVAQESNAPGFTIRRLHESFVGRHQSNERIGDIVVGLFGRGKSSQCVVHHEGMDAVVECLPRTRIALDNPIVITSFIVDDLDSSLRESEVVTEILRDWAARCEPMSRS